MGLKLDLEDMFGRPVDLGTPDTLRPEMRSERRERPHPCPVTGGSTSGT